MAGLTEISLFIISTNIVSFVIYFPELSETLNIRQCGLKI